MQDFHTVFHQKVRLQAVEKSDEARRNNATLSANIRF